MCSSSRGRGLKRKTSSSNPPEIPSNAIFRRWQCFRRNRKAQNSSTPNVLPRSSSTIKVLRVRSGDLLITRSGTIGRVAYATPRLVGAVVSDDMIRVRIKDEVIRFYVYAYLQSFAGHNQMLKNEYGSVQQHLEAKHISGILIPIPPNWKDVEQIVAPTRAAIHAREKL